MKRPGVGGVGQAEGCIWKAHCLQRFRRHRSKALPLRLSPKIPKSPARVAEQPPPLPENQGAQHREGPSLCCARPLRHYPGGGALGEAGWPRDLQEAWLLAAVSISICERSLQRCWQSLGLTTVFLDIWRGLSNANYSQVQTTNMELRQALSQKPL